MAELAAENESLIRDLGLERYWSMVKKAKTRSHRGDGIATRGFTKGRMY